MLTFFTEVVHNTNLGQARNSHRDLKIRRVRQNSIYNEFDPERTIKLNQVK